MLLVILKNTGDVCGHFEGMTSSPAHAYLTMGCTVVRFRDFDGVPWELPLSEVSFK